jgi:hypothetical protein
MRIASLLLAGIVSLSSLIAAEPAAEGTNASGRGFGRFLDSIFGRKAEPTGTTNRSASGSEVIGKAAGTRELQNFGTNQLNAALKEALEAGFKSAIARLGQTNGFLTNLQVRISLPEQLAPLERALRKLHEDALVDQFEAAMNHAAEKAVPAAADVLLQSIRQISVSDATALLASKSATAVTDYFRSNAATNLYQRFLPIVQQATESAGVTAAYKKLLDRVPLGAGLFSRSTLDLDHYVTTKALNGLFQVAGDEERRIRENPQARTTELLQKVFGAIGRSR